MSSGIVRRRPRSARSWTKSIVAPGAVFVAGRPDRLGILEAAQVFGEDLGSEHHGIAQQVAQEEFGLGADQPFGQSARLDQEEPMKARGRCLLVDSFEAVERRHDVEQRQALDPLGMIAREAVGDARPAVVAGEAKRSKPSAAIVSTWSCAKARFE
jgi:hypothetical protein